MKKLLLIIGFTGWLMPVQLIAQEVYKENGKYILDLTEATGMPKGAITATPKSWSGSASINEGPLANNTERETINATAFQKLEISSNDMDAATGIINSGNLNMNWILAYNGCKRFKDDSGKGGWRLPTQRELMLIFIFKPALESLGMPAFASKQYWSITESSATHAWHVHFGTGGTEGAETNNNVNYTEKYSSNRVRCVREVQNTR